MKCPKCGEEMTEIELSNPAKEEYENAHRCDNPSCPKGVTLKEKD